MSRRLLLTALVAVSVAAAADPNPADRTNLLTYRDDRDRPIPVRTVADWAHRRAAILAAMQEVMGPLPGPEKKVPLDEQSAPAPPKTQTL